MHKYIILYSLEYDICNITSLAFGRKMLLYIEYHYGVSIFICLHNGQELDPYW